MAFLLLPCPDPATLLLGDRVEWTVATMCDSDGRLVEAFLADYRYSPADTITRGLPVSEPDRCLP